MGSLFSRARGGSEATDGDTDLISEVKAATRVASTPGTPRAALPLPPNGYPYQHASWNPGLNPTMYTPIAHDYCVAQR